METVGELIDKFPFMASPAALAMADMGERFQVPPHVEHMNRELVELKFGDSNRLMINCSYQHGKQIADTVKVPTPAGWKLHGNLRVGDIVYSPSGDHIPVEAVGPKAMQDCEVVFTDGSAIRCHENHEWVVYENYYKKWRVVETRYLEKRKLLVGKSRRAILRVGNPAPLAGRPFQAPVHPYVLGAWLGDGRSESAQLSWGDDGTEVIAAIEALGYPISSRWTQENTGVHYANFSNLREGLREVGVFANKHIPQEYLLASTWQREELLAGLIDTDGSYSADSGQYRFINTNERLIGSVVELARSLGFRVGKVQRYEPCESSSGIVGTKPTFVVAFSATRTLPCRLPRKVPKWNGVVESRGITEVRRVTPEQGNCIQVEGGQYLVGETLIPTHNSLLGTIYHAAWNLLWEPNDRIIIVGNEEDFATNTFGEPVRDIIKRWGPEFGIKIKPDSRAKGAWKIDGHDGGVSCKGPHGGIVGRAADLFLIDDLIRNAEEALSATVMENHWLWYKTTVQGRMRKNTRVCIINTRWGKRDLCGKILAEAKATGEQWRHIKYKAIADENDPLGRKPGEALWPEQVPLAQLLVSRHKNPFWEAAWQQEPREEEGAHFSPGLWPRYYAVPYGWAMKANGVLTEVRRDQLFIVVSVDWAATARKRSDYTAIGVFGITPQNNVLVLEVVNERFPLAQCVPELDKVCKKWRPGMVVVESNGFQEAVALECRRYPAIPEPHRAMPHGNTKLQRAWNSIKLAAEGRIYTPEYTEKDTRWLNDFEEQLLNFTGDDDEHDDIVDMLSHFIRECQSTLILPSNYERMDPVVLIPGMSYGE